VHRLTRHECRKAMHIFAVL